MEKTVNLRCYTVAGVIRRRAINRSFFQSTNRKYLSPAKQSGAFVSFSSASPLSASCSLEKQDPIEFANGATSSLSESSCAKLLQVVLVSPQIPGNTGSIARTCAASAVGLHLVGAGEKRLLALTKRGTTIHSDFKYKKGDWLVFGSETRGLPPEALEDCGSAELGGGTHLRIPMVDTYVRCLNLSVSVGIALYEAARQLNYEQLEAQPEPGSETQRLFFRDDIYG